MVVTFLLLLPVGVSISRYSRPVFPHSWFRAHALTNSTAVILMLLGLAAVLGHTRGSFSVVSASLASKSALELMQINPLSCCLAGLPPDCWGCLHLFGSLSGELCLCVCMCCVWLCASYSCAVFTAIRHCVDTSGQPSVSLYS